MAPASLLLGVYSPAQAARPPVPIALPTALRHYSIFHETPKPLTNVPLTVRIRDTSQRVLINLEESSSRHSILVPTPPFPVPIVNRRPSLAMGNLCGKAEKDNFSSPGRVVGSAPAQNKKTTAPVPKKVGGPGRTLGGPSSANTAAEDPEHARRKAAEAAEVGRTSPSCVLKIHHWLIKVHRRHVQKHPISLEASSRLSWQPRGSRLGWTR